MSDQGLGNTATVQGTFGPDTDNDPFAKSTVEIIAIEDRGEYYRDELGRWARKPDNVGLHLVTGTTSALNQPTENTTMTEPFTPETAREDATRFARWFQYAADQIVDASQLRKEVEELRGMVQELKHDVETYRTHIARLDEEVTRLRAERVDLQRENGILRAERDDERNAHKVTADRLLASQRDSEHWQQSYIQLSTELDTLRRERDAAQMRVLELDDSVRVLGEENKMLEANSTALALKLDNARSALDNARTAMAA